MIVYGDLVRVAAASEILDEIATRLARAAGSMEEARRDGRVAALILAGQLQQALEDREFARRGGDDLTPIGDAAGALTLAIARLAGDDDDCGIDGLTDRVRRLSPEERLFMRRPEGYAFYAVHPLAYFEAGRAWTGRLGAVIGLRSIGTSLAAAVSAGAGLPRAFSLRPAGQPFARRITASAGLLETIGTTRGDIGVVDEGPGLSGSSFGSVADWLEGGGVDPARMVFFPSHGGDPGPQACGRHRARWAAARKVAPATRWPSEAALRTSLGRPELNEDISGGQWREPLLSFAPADPSRERLKLRLTTDRGRFLIKFAGYGAFGEEKLDIARVLHQAGFGAQPVGLFDGFLATRWIDGVTGVDGVPRADLSDRLGSYLSLRAERFPAPANSGAPLTTLVDMARCNFAETGLGGASAQLDRFDLGVLAASWRPVRVDGRLHAWEWITLADGRLLKLDALDHHASHDLIGCQDPVWDLAGAEVEFDLDPNERESLLSRYGRSIDPEALHLARLLYLGFQIGLWTMAFDAAPPQDQPAIERLLAKYRAAL